VRASDKVGNRGISRPIAVCLDSSQIDGQPSCTTDLDEAPPDCSDACNPPPDFDPNGWIMED
jgi:hypothetical protein